MHSQAGKSSKNIYTYIYCVCAYIYTRIYSYLYIYICQVNIGYTLFVGTFPVVLINSKSTRMQ